MLNFNPSDYAEAPILKEELLTPGIYDAQIVDCDIKQSRANHNNEYLQVTLVIIAAEREYVVVDRLIIKHSSKKALDWGRHKICKLSESANIEEPKTAMQFVGHNVTVEIKNENDLQYGDKNIVENYIARTKSTTQTRAPAIKNNYDDQIPF